MLGCYSIYYLLKTRYFIVTNVPVKEPKTFVDIINETREVTCINSITVNDLERVAATHEPIKNPEVAKRVSPEKCCIYAVFPYPQFSMEQRPFAYTNTLSQIILRDKCKNVVSVSIVLRRLLSLLSQVSDQDHIGTLVLVTLLKCGLKI